MDTPWKWAESRVRGCLRLKSVTTRWGVSTTLFGLLLSCVFTLIQPLASSRGGEVSVWLLSLLIFLAVLFLYGFISFWFYVARNPSDDDEERKQRKIEMNAIIKKLDITPKELKEAEKEINKKQGKVKIGGKYGKRQKG
jgi:type VI protein secretion system component VasK